MDDCHFEQHHKIEKNKIKIEKLNRENKVRKEK
jgi:hypothetical protein